MKREKAVTFKGNPITLVGPELKVGDKAPDFKVLSVLDLKTLADTPAKVRIFSVVPSIDTPTCNQQTHRFDTELATLKDKVAAFTFSLDLPFAQKRFCTAENITNHSTFSDVHDHSFGKAYGVLIEGLPLPLLTRAVFVVDAGGVIRHVEYVSEVTTHPNYDAVLAAVKKLI